MTSKKRTAQAAKDFRDGCKVNGYNYLPLENAVEGVKASGKKPWRPYGKWEVNSKVLDSNHTNTGIPLAGGFVAIDADLREDDFATSNLLMEAIKEYGGTFLVRRTRKDLARFTVLFRFPTGIAKQHVARHEIIDGKKTKIHEVEVLSDGQYFVADGWHSSGEELEWDDGISPANLPIADLPFISEETMKELLIKIIDILNATDWTIHGHPNASGSKTTSQKATATATTNKQTTPGDYNQTDQNNIPFTMVDLADYIDNHPGAVGMDYDEWLLYMSAIYNISCIENALVDGKMLANEWSSKNNNPKHDQVFFNDKWIAFGRGGATHHDAGWLINQAKKEKMFWVSPSLKAKLATEKASTNVVFPAGFIMNANGLYYEEADGEATSKPTFIASRFEVVGETTNTRGGETGILIKFMHRDIVCHEVIGKDELHDTRNDFVKRLASKGLTIAPGKYNSLKLFFNYVKAPWLVHTNKAGWHKTSFLFNDGSEFNAPGMAAPVIMNPAN